MAYLQFFATHPGIGIICAIVCLTLTGFIYRTVVTCSRHFWLYMACRKADDHVMVAQLHKAFENDNKD